MWDSDISHSEQSAAVKSIMRQDVSVLLSYSGFAKTFVFRGTELKGGTSYFGEEATNGEFSLTWLMMLKITRCSF